MPKLYDPNKPSVAGLVEIMETEGLTQRQVGNMTGVTDSTVRKWLRKADDDYTTVRGVPPLACWKVLLLETGRDAERLLIDRKAVMLSQGK